MDEDRKYPLIALLALLLVLFSAGIVCGLSG